MEKDEILKALALKDKETLEALYKIAAVFSPEELKKISIKVQNKATRSLIKNYM
jgi:hypothetical protein